MDGTEQGVEENKSDFPRKHKHTVGQEPDKIDEILTKNRRLATPFVLNKCEENAAKNWDLFYKHHEDRFFKNKNWTDREFAELGKEKEGNTKKVKDDDSAAALDDPMLSKDIEAQNTVLLEVGCGPGNLLYPVLGRNATIKAHSCDFSPRAIDIVKAHPSFDSDRINAFVHDLVKDFDAPLSTSLANHPFGSPTVVCLIFVLSAIPPQHHRAVLRSLVDCLPVGGTLYFRDFAHGDLSQLRFHQKASAAWSDPSLLSEDKDFYKRGDNTFTYFFTLEEMMEHAKALGLQGDVNIKEIHGLNRKTGVQLHRRFIQGRWKVVA